jgi:hypothetical protein
VPFSICEARPKLQISFMKYCYLVLVLPILLAGCGEPAAPSASSLPDSTPADPAPTSMDLSSEAPDTAPPPGEVAGALAEAEAEPLRMVDDEGNALTALAYLQQAVDTYDRSRAGTATADSDGWPELTDLSQLVKYRIVRRLPPAPPGQRFVFDAKTGKVGLVNQ